MAFLVHRWLGVALALLMAVWTLSGITMMYVAYPETSERERLAGLQPLDTANCCTLAEELDGAIDSAAIEMWLGRPVLRIVDESGQSMIPLDGAPLPAIGAVEARQAAAAHMRHAFGRGAALEVATTERDQWTVSGSFRRHAPLYKAQVADGEGTELYVSGVTGEIVQDTTRTERLWNWVGAVPHWLYFTALRDNQLLWYNVVVYASLLGVFLTVTGIYVGVMMYGRGKRKSPFRGAALWHHWTGLIFGVVTLTWVASGLFSMNPWGWFESAGPGEAIPNLAGRPAEGADATRLAAALATRPVPGVVRAELALQQGRPFAILLRDDGSRARAALPGLEPALPGGAELAALARTAKPGTPIVDQRMITEGDAYHYGHKGNDPVLPAWRAIYGDEAATRLYFDARTGELVKFSDAQTRAFRWWHLGLHRLDFPVLRARPLWDLVTLPLLIGVSLVCLLGLWMGIKRLRRPSGPMRRGRG
jgi:hypothetical protein